MASRTDVETTTMEQQDVSLKKVDNIWLLNISGQLKRFNELRGAKNVHIDDNVIFADDTLYHIVEKCNGDVFLEEIKEENNNLSTSLTENSYGVGDQIIQDVEKVLKENATLAKNECRNSLVEDEMSAENECSDPLGEDETSAENECSDPLGEDETSAENECSDPLGEDETSAENECSDPLGEDETSAENECSDPLVEAETSAENECSDPLGEDETSAENECSDPLGEGETSAKNECSNPLVENEMSAKNECSNPLGDETSATNECSNPLGDEMSAQNGCINPLGEDERSANNECSNPLGEDETSSKNECSDLLGEDETSAKKGCSNPLGEDEMSAKNECSNPIVEGKTSAENECSNQLGENGTSAKNECSNPLGEGETSAKNECSNPLEEDEMSAKGECSNPLGEGETSAKNECSNPLGEDETSAKGECSNPLGEGETSAKNKCSNPLGEGETSAKNECSNPLGEGETSAKNECSNPLGEDETSAKGECSNPLGEGETSAKNECSNPLEEGETSAKNECIYSLGEDDVLEEGYKEYDGMHMIENEASDSTECGNSSEEDDISETGHEECEDSTDSEDKEPDGNESRNTSEQDDKEYFNKKGMIRTIFGKMKQIVKRKPSLLNQKLHHDDIHKRRGTSYFYTDDIHITNENLTKLEKSATSDKAVDNKSTTVLKYSSNIDSGTIEPSEPVIVYALFDFDAFLADEISFKKRDQLELLTVSSPYWCLAKHTGTGKTGYIPQNYITRNKIELNDWWYNVERNEADRQLLLPGNPTGTFLISEAEDKASYRLNVRAYDPKTNDACVKHYRIRQLDNGGVYISPKRTFDNMLDLIFHYRNAADGLCCKLVTPCPKVRPLEQFKELEVPRESVKLLKKLGSGCFGEVYAGKWRNTVDVGVKTLKQGQMSTDDFLAGAKHMHHLRHAKQLMAVCTKTEPIWIITELMINGPLLSYLRKDEGKTLQFNELVNMAGQIADGMAYLETENCVHRDLRAFNILVSDHNKVKVAGLGLADTKFPIKWTAPEAAIDGKFSIKSDVWSYGVLLYELITFGRSPYPGMSGQDVLNRVEKGFRMQKPTDGPVPCPDPYYEIMLKCWNSMADSRPTFAFLNDFFSYYEIYIEPLFLTQHN